MTKFNEISAQLKMKSRLLIPVILLLVAAPLSWSILNPEKPGGVKVKKGFTQIRRIVNVRELTRRNFRPEWNATGLVQAAESVELKAEVSGKLIDLNPEANPGALMNAGDWLLQLDRRDYEFVLRGKHARLVNAETDLKLEQGNQLLASQELEMAQSALGEDSLVLNDRQLILREPQIAAARADVDNAEAELDQARLDLSRTRLEMPFRGKILQRYVGRGSRVSTNNSLFDVVNVDYFWVEVKVPRAFLARLDSQVEARLSQPQLWGEGIERRARVVSILPDVDNSDRQARVLLAVDDPLGLEGNNLKPVYLNDLLNVKLAGKTLENVWAIEPSWLLPSNDIWVVGKGNSLRKRPVKVLFKQRDKIYVNAKFRDGEVAVSEKLSYAVVGMKVKPRKQVPFQMTEVSP